MENEEYSIAELLEQLNGELDRISESKTQILKKLYNLGSYTAIYGVDVKIEDIPECIDQVAFTGGEIHTARVEVNYLDNPSTDYISMTVDISRASFNPYDISSFTVIFVPNFINLNLGGRCNVINDGSGTPIFENRIHVVSGVDISDSTIQSAGLYFDDYIIRASYTFNNYYNLTDYVIFDDNTNKYYVSGKFYMSKTRG